MYMFIYKFIYVCIYVCIYNILGQCLCDVSYIALPIATMYLIKDIERDVSYRKYEYIYVNIYVYI